MANVVTSITTTWSAVASWFVETLNTVPAIFYDSETGLTFIGTLAIFGGGLAIIIGLIGMVRGFLKAR